MESASESPSAWSDLMVLSDDSDLLSDEYISHNKQISPPIQNEMIEGESPRCDNDVSAHVDRMSMSTLCPSPPRLAVTGNSSTSSSSLSLLGPPLNNATLSPISPPAEFKDESDFKDTESDFKDTEESDFKDTLRREEGVDESGAESCSTLESYSNKLSNLVLQDTKQSLCKTPSVSTTWKFQLNPTVVPTSHPIVRPKPTRARTSVNAAPFQSTSSHRQSDLNSSSGAGPGASDASLPIYSAPIDTLDTRTRSRMRVNNSNCLMMAHVHEILNDLYATPTGNGSISITHDSLSLTRRRKKNRGSNGGTESGGLKHKASIASTSSGSSSTGAGAASKHFHNSSSFVINIKKPKKSSLKHSHHQKSKHYTTSSTTHATPSVETGHTKPLRAKRKHQLKLKRFKQTLCRLFTFKTSSLPKDDELGGSNTASESVLVLDVSKTCFSERALPPVPGNAVGSVGVATEGVGEGGEDGDDGACAFNMDFASSIEKVKDYGWYWGPISSEAAEKILSTEPDGSFIVRDSSDDHYIFSLTFKLNACVRHVRIEHYQGNFSFGSCTKFKSHTIVDFIENAVEHSRSGRYLFFLHRRPILGPMRVQLLHPVSRFKQVQSLQHMCRFVILKIVRKDHINQLPLPDRLQAYLNTPHYYCESSEQFDATAPTTITPSEES